MIVIQKNLIICHDAGRAEILSAYVKAHEKKAIFYCVVAGPAEKIFRRKKYKIIQRI